MIKMKLLSVNPVLKVSFQSIFLKKKYFLCFNIKANTKILKNISRFSKLIQKKIRS